MNNLLLCLNIQKVNDRANVFKVKANSSHKAADFKSTFYNDLHCV